MVASESSRVPSSRASANRERGGVATRLLRYVGFGVVGLAVLFGTIWFGVMKATAAPERVITTFLTAVTKGDYAAAHACFAAPLKEVQPLETFTSSATANATLFRVRSTTFTSRSRELDRASFAGTVELESGTAMPCSFVLVEENDDWKLIGYHIGAGS